MKHFRTHSGEIYGFEEDGSQDHLITEDMVLLTGKALEDEFKPPELTPEQIQQKYVDAIQLFMDRKAAEKKYDNIKSAALRAALPNSPFHAEGLAAGTWMDNCWALSYQVLAEVKNGTRPMPTIEELIDMMPELVW